jgi:transposase
MPKRLPLGAEDELERRILADIAALGGDARKRAAEELGVSVDVINRMWASDGTRPRRPMRLEEATILAKKLLGMDLRLVPIGAR